MVRLKTVAGIVIVALLGFAAYSFTSTATSSKEKSVWVTVDWEPIKRSGQGNGVDIVLLIRGHTTHMAPEYSSPFVRVFNLEPGQKVSLVAKQDVGTRLRCLISQGKGMENKMEIFSKGTVSCQLIVT